VECEHLIWANLNMLHFPGSCKHISSAQQMSIEYNQPKRNSLVVFFVLVTDPTSVGGRERLTFHRCRRQRRIFHLHRPVHELFPMKNKTDGFVKKQAVPIYRWINKLRKNCRNANATSRFLASPAVCERRNLFCVWSLPATAKTATILSE